MNIMLWFVYLELAKNYYVVTRCWFNHQLYMMMFSWWVRALFGILAYVARKKRCWFYHQNHQTEPRDGSCWSKQLQIDVRDGLKWPTTVLSCSSLAKIDCLRSLVQNVFVGQCFFAFRSASSQYHFTQWSKWNTFNPRVLQSRGLQKFWPQNRAGLAFWGLWLAREFILRIQSNLWMLQELQKETGWRLWCWERKGQKKLLRSGAMEVTGSWHGEILILVVTAQKSKISFGICSRFR